jgi:hypothetical protein
LKILQPAKSATKGGAPVLGDYSFADPKTPGKLLEMRILDPVHDPSGRQCSIPAHRDSGLHQRIFGRLPLAFNRLAGSMIYPHLD